MQSETPNGKVNIDLSDWDLYETAEELAKCVDVSIVAGDLEIAISLKTGDKFEEMVKKISKDALDLFFFSGDGPFIDLVEGGVNILSDSGEFLIPWGRKLASGLGGLSLDSIDAPRALWLFQQLSQWCESRDMKFPSRESLSVEEWLAENQNG